MIGGIVWGIVVSTLALVALSVLGAPPREPVGETPAPEAVPRPEPASPDVAAPETKPEAPTAVPTQNAEPAEPDTAPAEAGPVARPATDIVLPPGSEFNRPPPETQATLPATEPEPRGAPKMRAPEPGEAVADVPVISAAPAAVPEIETAGPGEMAAPAAAAAPRAMEAEEPVLPSPGVMGPSSPEMRAPSAVAEPGKATAEEGQGNVLRATPPSTPGGEAGSALPDQDRGPESGSDPGRPSGGDTGAVSGDATQNTAAAGETGALARNAVPFRAEGTKPLVSVILIDVGEAGLDRQALLSIAFPVTIALDPTRPDAAEAAAAYRASGHELVTLAAGLPENATPHDAKEILGRDLAALDSTVALMDLTEGGFETRGPLTAEAVALVETTGHGLITFDRGLRMAERLAAQSGVRQARVDLVLDAERPDAAQIRRSLDRALFEARQSGHAILLGHSYPETVSALYAWSMETEGITLAPVSALLRLP